MRSPRCIPGTSSARPLATLQEATGFGGLIAVLSGGRAVYVDHFRGTDRALGRAFPAHATALGKAIIAEMGSDARDAALAELVLAPWTTRTITDRDRLVEDLAGARERGYALEDGEFHEARRSIGAAVRDHTGTVVAAVGVGAPASRLPDEVIDEVARAVVASGRRGVAPPRRRDRSRPCLRGGRWSRCSR